MMEVYHLSTIRMSKRLKIELLKVSKYRVLGFWEMGIENFELSVP